MHIFNKKWCALLLMAVCVMTSSCSSDEDIAQTPVSDNYQQIAETLLTDSVVLNARAEMGNVNKTLLENGCPVKFYFHWNDGSDTPLNIQLKNFSVGKMPVTVYFNIDCKLMQLNSWEKDEYKGAGWVKFQGEHGATTYTPNENDESNEYKNGSGGSGFVTGYLNVLTKQIEFSMNFNVMLMQSYVFQQTIDPSRMATFDADFAQYEEDLAAYKKAHGL